MSKKKKTVEQDILVEQISKFNEHYFKLMSAVMTQDVQKCEENLRLAQGIYKNIEARLDQDSKVFLCNKVNLMEAATRFLKATLYQADDRLNKSLDEFNAAKQVCADADGNFDSLSVEAEKILNEDGEVSQIRFMFSYYENTIGVFREVVKKSLDRRNGKFVNQVELYRQAAAELKKEDYLEYLGENESTDDLVSALVGMLGRMADSYERKAERLEEKMEDIEYVAPIDKKVFIVHGHNEAALNELKELLINEFNIAPIVLWKERDDGKTVIEKFEHYGRISAFAFVLATPDDAIAANELAYFQARPNVLFELGWFYGRYGRKKVRILKQKKTQLPSDLGGIITYDFDEKISEISADIRADLINAGILE